MKIQEPTLGPILGYTTSSEVRIWLRGDFQKAPGGYRRAFGVVRIRPSGDGDYGPPKYAKLPPYFDMTGVCVFTGLEENREYDYEAGWFFADTGLENLDSGQALRWDNAFRGRFRTGSASPEARRSYVIGSCRYLLTLFGGAVWDVRGDKTFLSIGKQIDEGRQADGLIMMGDQIYADDLNFALPDTRVDEYLERYRLVFGQEHLRGLMSRVPTYMVLDDHEIEDNWPSKASKKDWLTLFPAAIHAYQIYQCSHSPLFEIDDSERITGTPERFWYTFSDGCCDWFVMDCRTERQLDGNAGGRRMINVQQEKALKDWFLSRPGRVKLVVTSVPFFPDSISGSDDKWSGFPGQRAEILDFIVENKIPKVVFLSGDVHCSFCAEIRTAGNSSSRIFTVVASSFFWPYPHMEEKDFQFQGRLNGTSKHAFEIGRLSGVHATDNFARLEVEPSGFRVGFYRRMGPELETVRVDF